MANDVSKIVPITKNSVGPIESHVPIPLKSSKGGRKIKYPVADLEVGDSFTVPIGMIGSLRSVVSRYAYNNPKRKFTTRTEGDRVRVWRIK